MRDQDKLVRLRGRVRSGVGSFTHWIERLADHYERKRIRFYPGTLNVELDQHFSVPAVSMRLEATDYDGTVSVNIAVQDQSPACIHSENRCKRAGTRTPSKDSCRGRC